MRADDVQNEKGEDKRMRSAGEWPVPPRQKQTKGKENEEQILQRPGLPIHGRNRRPQPNTAADRGENANETLGPGHVSRFYERGLFRERIE